MMCKMMSVAAMGVMLAASVANADYLLTADPVQVNGQHAGDISAFTIKITDNKPTYFSYSWCAADEKTLQQNYQHINATLYINGEKLGKDVVHNLSYQLQNGMFCGDFGALLSDWPTGKYELKAIATFDQKINDGISDYDAGDYVFVYNVTAGK